MKNNIFLVYLGIFWRLCVQKTNKPSFNPYLINKDVYKNYILFNTDQSKQYKRNKRTSLIKYY